MAAGGLDRFGKTFGFFGSNHDRALRKSKDHRVSGIRGERSVFPEAFVSEQAGETEQSPVAKETDGFAHGVGVYLDRLQFSQVYRRLPADSLDEQPVLYDPVAFDREKSRYDEQGEGHQFHADFPGD